MINVTMRRVSMGTRFLATGHSAPHNGRTELLRVCAGVSALLVTLHALYDGKWDGEGNGHVDVMVPNASITHASFAYAGLRLISENYPDHVTLDVGPGFEGGLWKKPQL